MSNLIPGPQNTSKPSSPYHSYRRLPPLESLAVPESLLWAAQQKGQLQYPSKLIEPSQIPSEASISLLQNLQSPTHNATLPTLNPSLSSSQIPPLHDFHIRAAKRSEEQKFLAELNGVERLMKDMKDRYGIRTLGRLFYLLFYLPSSGGNDPHSKTHIDVIGAWLRGHDASCRPLDLINSIYYHDHSWPSYRSRYKSQRDLIFETPAIRLFTYQ
jgi:hypothetical protein